MSPGPYSNFLRRLTDVSGSWWWLSFRWLSPSTLRSRGSYSDVLSQSVKEERDVPCVKGPSVPTRCL